MQERIKQLRADIQKNRFNPRLIRHFDWPLFLLVIGISLFGIVSIYAATAKATEEEVHGLAQVLNTHPITYARLQFFWMLAGIIAMCAMIFFNYHLFGRYADLIYWANIFILLAVLSVEAVRGGLTAFFQWGSRSRTLGPLGF